LCSNREPLCKTAMATINDIGYGWKLKYPTIDAQAEYFLLKFGKEVTRDEVQKLKVQFAKFDSKGQGELEEDQAMRLLESRNETKTFRELRESVAEIDIDKNRKLCFLEWACAIFNKSWAVLHAPSVDPEEVRRAQEIADAAERELAEAKEKADKHREEEEQATLAALRAKGNQAEVEAEIARQAAARKKRDEDEAAAKKLREEQLAELRARELAQSGVAGKAALFKYAAADTQDPTKNNEARIRAEAAKRREAKEAEERAAIAKKKAAEEATAAEKAAAEKARLKAIAEKEAAEKEAARLKAEEEKRKALAGDEKMRVEREAYEKAKAEAEAKARAKAEAEAAAREASRQRLAAKAALWNQKTSPSAVFNEINSGAGPSLKKTATRESTTVVQAKVLGGIKKGVPLNSVSAPSSDLTEAQKQAFVEDRRASAAGDAPAQ